jgi:TadE-like protein
MTTTTSINKILRSKKGQSLVELTLITPFMLLLVYGVVEVGSVISTYLTLTHTTREGANLTSRGTDPNIALDAIIAAAAPTIRGNNLAQWRIIYSRLVQKPLTVCPSIPPPSCIYVIDNVQPNGQIIRGNFSQTSKLGNVGDTVTISGMNNVAPNQTFHVIEVYYDYRPNVITFVGNSINKIFYDRTIFTNVSAIN